MKNQSPPASQRLGLPLPPPKQKKIKNIRNVNQGFFQTHKIKAQKFWCKISAWDHAGLLWHGKRPSRKWEKNGKPNGKEPQLNSGKNGKKRPENGEKWRKLPRKSILFATFAPVQLALFSIWFSIFFPFPAFGRFPSGMPMPARHFVRKFVPRKMFRANFVLQTCHPKEFCWVLRPERRKLTN